MHNPFRIYEIQVQSCLSDWKHSCCRKRQELNLGALRLVRLRAALTDFTLNIDDHPDFLRQLGLTLQ